MVRHVEVRPLLTEEAARRRQHVYGALVLLAAGSLGVAMFLPYYDVVGVGSRSAFGLAGNRHVWLVGLPVGYLLAAGAVMLTIAAVMALGRSPATTTAAVLPLVVAFGVWLLLAVEYGYVLSSIQANDPVTFSAVSTNELISPGTGWWLAGIGMWLALAGGIGLFVTSVRRARRAPKADDVSPWTSTTE
jgi:hypothetical protein